MHIMYIIYYVYYAYNSLNVLYMYKSVYLTFPTIVFSISISQIC